MAVTDHFNNYSLLYCSFYFQFIKKTRKELDRKSFWLGRYGYLNCYMINSFQGFYFKKCLITKNFQTFLTNFFCTNFDVVHTAMTSGQKSCNKCGEFCLTDVMNIPISSTKLI